MRTPTHAQLSLVLLATTAAAPAGPAFAQPDPDYYDAVTGTTGPTIKSQLTTLTNDAIFRSYDQARNILQVTDEDPTNEDNIILVYSDASIASGWTSGSTWNREHCWPRSLGVGSSGSDNSDLHMLRPCNPSVNSSRGNKAFGSSAGRWDPDRFGGTYRGEMARVAFYANTRYTYLNMSVIGTQSELVDWHFEQMPDAADIERNNRVEIYQSNRNPFVDRPEWVWPIYGTFPSDARIDVAGTTTIDLGRFIAGGSPTQATIDLVKTGVAPTTYLVSASGDISTPAATGLQAGFMRNTQARSIPVSIVSTLGPISGTVTIDTTEPTSAAAGQGSQDPTDTVTVSGTALAPAVASLDQSSETGFATIDLGVLDPSGPGRAVTIWNLADPATGAALDIDGVSLVGDTSIDLVGAPIVGVPAGGSADLSVVAAEGAASGPFVSVATVTVSDEDVPGAASRQLTITLSGTIGRGCPADVNGDGILGPNDFSAWIFAFNNRDPECDINGDGQCLANDYSAWILAFNAGCP
ncbi:MAG: endonuclease [Planctomycetota bacterium]